MTTKIEDLEVAQQERSRQNALAAELANRFYDWRCRADYIGMARLSQETQEFPTIFRFENNKAKRAFVFNNNTPAQPFWQIGDGKEALTDIEFAKRWLEESAYRQTPGEAFMALQDALWIGVENSVHQFRMHYDSAYAEERIARSNTEHREREAALSKQFWKSFWRIVTIVVAAAVVVAIITYGSRHGMAWPLG